MKEELRVGMTVKVKRHPKGWFGNLDRYTRDGREAVIEEILQDEVVVKFKLDHVRPGVMSAPYNVGFKWLEKADG